jgi:hypothetical protein
MVDSVSTVSAQPIPPPGAFVSSFGYQEPIEELSPKTRDMHRTIVCLMEEREALDW